MKEALVASIRVFFAAVLLAHGEPAVADTHRVWEKVEISLEARNSFANPYTEVQVWVELEGPGFRKRCYGFWDGGNTFRVRVLATAPGRWTWRSGANVADPGLDGVAGDFSAVAWDEAEKRENPCRRGMIGPSANGHAFQYADGTPFFLLGDTWWATPTFRFRWYEDDRPRPLGAAAGFKDYVRYRKGQGYNSIAMIAAFPNWANDGQPPRLKTPEGTVLRSAWRQAGTDSAKDMTNEDGERAFLFPGKVPGYERIFPDLDRLNSAYFRSLDRKIDYLNARGFVPFIEVARRDIGQGWKKYHAWPDSYARYIQYVWSRYQANICLFSPIHYDWEGDSIPAEEWNEAANRVIDTFGPPPFGTLAGTNSNPSTLRNFGHVDRARWLRFHQIGNRRTHDLYPYLTEVFEASPPVPGINGEPYYDGMLDAPCGSRKAALYCRSAMYGSVLSGGLGGHIYGAGGWDGGLWGGDIEEAAKHPIWEAIRWPSAGQMRHLATFVLSSGRKYQNLVPGADLLAPNRTGKADGCTGWAYCARTPLRDLFLLYFEKDSPRATVSGAREGGRYSPRWFDPRTGEWSTAGSEALVATPAGQIVLPPYPDGTEVSETDWALALSLDAPFRVTEDDERIRIVGSTIEASIRKKDYVSGVEARSFLDRTTGFRDLGFGLDIVDWIMEPGSDEAYRDQLPGDLVYHFNNPYHGKRPKRSIEGPQICTKAGRLSPRVIYGPDFVAVEQDSTYRLAAPGRKAGSRWEQTIVFPEGTRYFISCDRITTVNSSDAMFLRVDMPGHLRHKGGDTFSEIYLSYHGKIPSSEFLEDFPPDEKFLYVREAGKVPPRMIRAYRIRDPGSGADGPWLAGMTLDAAIVSEAWCHQRGYVCFIEEFGGRPIKPGESFSAAFIVGFFDSIEEMHRVYDRYAGSDTLEVDARGWTLTSSRQINRR